MQTISCASTNMTPRRLTPRQHKPHTSTLNTKSNILLYTWSQTWWSSSPECCPGQGLAPLLRPRSVGGGPETCCPPSGSGSTCGSNMSPETVSNRDGNKNLCSLHGLFFIVLYKTGRVKLIWIKEMCFSRHLSHTDLLFMGEITVATLPSLPLAPYPSHGSWSRSFPGLVGRWGGGSVRPWWR